MDRNTSQTRREKTIVAKASHALLTLLSILLMAVAFSHPARSDDAARPGQRGEQGRQVDANAASLGHVIVPAKEFLRKAQAFKAQPKKWHPSWHPTWLAAFGPVDPVQGALCPAACPAFEPVVRGPRPARAAHAARAPPVPLFLC